MCSRRWRAARTVGSGCAAGESNSTCGGRVFRLMALQGCDASTPLSTTIFNRLPFLPTIPVRGHLWLAGLASMTIGVVCGRDSGLMSRHGCSSDADRPQSARQGKALEPSRIADSCLFCGRASRKIGHVGQVWTIYNRTTALAS